MSTEASLIDAALRTWKQNIDRTDKFFSALSDAQLQQEIAPGKNRLIYLWGHLTAVNDDVRDTASDDVSAGNCASVQRGPP